MLKKYPTNSFLKNKIQQERKDYNKLVKQKQKEFINCLFSELDQMHDTNKKGYMDLVNTIKSGSFDKPTSDDTSLISPDTWREHFIGLLGPPLDQEPNQNIHLPNLSGEGQQNVQSKFVEPITKEEYIRSISSLKKNRSS